jgi:hypothetical protein
MGRPIDGQHSVIRVRTRETLCHPDISWLFIRGARECGISQAAVALAELVDQVQSRAWGIFIGFEEHTPRCIAVGHLPTSAFDLAGTVTLAYSEKAHKDLVALVSKQLRVWFRECGNTHALALNLKHTDRSFMVGLRHFGTPSPVGGVIRFDF